METIKNPFEFEFTVIYANGEKSRVPLAARRPRAILINGFAILMNDVKGKTFNEVEKQCQNVLVNGRAGGLPPQHFFHAMFARREALNSVLNKVGGEPLKDKDYVFISGEMRVLCNPMTGEVKPSVEDTELVARPVVYVGR